MAALGKLHSDLAPKDRKCRFNSRQLRRMMRVENPSRFLFVQAQPACELGVTDSGITHRQVNCRLEGDRGRHTDVSFAALLRRGCWDMSCC